MLDRLSSHAFVGTLIWRGFGLGREITAPRRAVAVLIAVAGCALLTRMLSSRRFFVRYVEDAPPEAVAWIRILACGVLLGSVLWEDLASIALLPPELRQPMGVMRFFYAIPGFAAFAASTAGLQALKWSAALLLFLGMVGCFTRIVIPLGAISYLLIGGIMRQYAYFYHQGIVPLYLLLVLSWAPCGDAWSVDRLRRARPTYRAAVYGWARYACWAVLAVTYVEAGLSKLWNGGLLWWTSENLRAIAYADTLNESRLARFNWGGVSLRLTQAPDVLFSVFGLLALSLEIGYGLVLFSRPARRILPAAAFLMHAGIFVLQKVLFFDFMLAQLMFVDVARIAHSIGRDKSNTAARHFGWPHHRLEGERLPPERSAVLRRPAASIVWPAAVAGMLGVLLVAWFLRIEYYPLTSWQMYSGRSTEVTYTRMYARHRSGAVTRAYVGDMIAALSGNRPQQYIRMCLSGDGAAVHKCETFLEAITVAHNRHAAPASHVTQLEIQEWSWDFLTYPSAPSRASLIGRFRFESTHGLDGR